MKHLKSTYRQIEKFITSSFSVQDIAEALVSFDANTQACNLVQFMNSRDFDVVGLRENGSTIGFVSRAEISKGCANEYVREFDPSDVISIDVPLIVAIDLLKVKPRLFIEVFDHVDGIVTKGDLQKAPVRMWMFSLITSLEMQLLRIIRISYPDGSWASVLSVPRFEKASTLLNQRKANNIAIDLADCLQFCDKRTIVLNNNSLREQLGIDSISNGEKKLKELERLRDHLAHGQDILSNSDFDLFSCAANASELLRKCEAVTA